MEFNEITLFEVEAAAANSALIANCSCPARYRATQWEQVWRDLRSKRLQELLGANQ